MPSYFPEGNTVESKDNELRVLMKICSLTASGGGGVGGGNPVDEQALGGAAPVTSTKYFVYDTDTGFKWYSGTKAAPWANW